MGIAALAYPKPELRPCGGDFDLFIKREDYARAKALLEKIGYCLSSPAYELYEIDYIGEVKFVKPNEGKKLMVELHLEFNANPWAKVSGFDFKGFWDNLLWAPLNDFSIPCLPVEANLFFLILHCAANHNFDRLMMFCDIDLLIRKYRNAIDWERIAEHAREKHCRKACYYCLAYCRQMLGTPVPVPFLEKLNPGFFSALFLPTRLLLLKEGAHPKSLKKYMHVFLLDNPFFFTKHRHIFTPQLFGTSHQKKNGILVFIMRRSRSGFALIIIIPGSTRKTDHGFYQDPFRNGWLSRRVPCF